MLDFPLNMLQVKLPVVQRIHSQSSKFATGVENRATGNSKLNDSPDYDISCHVKFHVKCVLGGLLGALFNAINHHLCIFRMR